MVVTALPATADTGVTQERTACPSTMTVQAPQAAMPQPNLVPVSAASSRSAHSSGFSGGASSATGFWLRVKFTGMRYSVGRLVAGDFATASA